jgi:hypothetical protein
MKRRLAILALLGPLLVPLARAEDKPIQVAYYYKVRWGFQQEFERLFFKNHYPLLKEQKDRIKDVQVFRPTYHGDGRSDWTFLVVITWTSWAALASVDEEALQRRLYPDQETFKKEEQRRFEILEAHWDVPLTPVPPPK